ncbi:Probable RNA-directed DNA polymerase from transposon X-element [Eumeta japonica]|uniref:Probable RNA-directed DNA polymerase from transposon X-element n=1 Tax=Eumeta variegata TaxID=151549 RepID=A0A4C1XTX1_EUMVA|nr:Probable RNA-directed DNA polymerase from transposon X-element [Eumeta japonica]
MTVFTQAAPKELDRFQVIQNKFCRDSTNAHWCVRNSVLYRDLKLPTTAKCMEDVSKRFLNIMESHPNRSSDRQPLMSHLNLIILSVGHGMYLLIHLSHQSTFIESLIDMSDSND